MISLSSRRLGEANHHIHLTLQWPLVTPSPKQAHTGPFYSKAGTVPIGQYLNHSCWLYSCSIPMTPRRIWELLEEISVHQPYTDYYHFTLLFHHFTHLMNMKVCSSMQKHVQWWRRQGGGAVSKVKSEKQ